MKKSKSQSLLKIAYVSKAHGIKGELFVRPLNAQFHWPHSIKEIIIGDTVFPVQKYSAHKEGMILKLDHCETRSSAEALKGQPVFLPKKLFKSKKGENIYLAELLSFHVEVSGYGNIGMIQSFQSDKHQDFLLVKKRNSPNQILIPFKEHYIKDIQFSKKTLILDLPDNFLEVFS